jgi:hypothetical protein
LQSTPVLLIIADMRNKELNLLNNQEYKVRAGLSARTVTLSICVHQIGTIVNAYTKSIIHLLNLQNKDFSTQISVKLSVMS